MDNSFAKDLSSYVSFALKLRPAINFPGHYDEKGKFIGKPARVKLNDQALLAEKELSTLSALMEKFKLLKPYLRPGSTLDNLKIVPKEYVEPKSDPAKGIEYKKITVNAGQLKVAKEVSAMVDTIYKMHSGGKKKEAKEKYEEFNKYLGKKRKELVGEFRTIGELEDSLALYGVGLNHADNGGAVIFVIIEVVVACPLVADIFDERALATKAHI